MTARDVFISALLVLALATIFIRPPWQWSVSVAVALALVIGAVWWLR